MCTLLSTRDVHNGENSAGYGPMGGREREDVHNSDALLSSRIINFVTKKVPERPIYRKEEEGYTTVHTLLTHHHPFHGLTHPFTP